MTLEELHDALAEWGRWARSDCGPPGYAISHIWAGWLPSQWWKDSGEDAPGAVEVAEAEPDEHACMALERAINGLQRRHRGWLVDRYVRQHYVDPVAYLEPAMRALLDHMGGDFERS